VRRTDDSPGRVEDEVKRAIPVVVLALLALYYLQFGVQALAHFIPQGILALVGGVALGWAAVRAARRRASSSIVFWGTLPMLILHLAMTIEDPGEMPFLLGSIPVPLVAGVAWVVLRRRREPG
jgi:uncharacterized membrane protein HdeD (DUF308 family)